MTAERYTEIINELVISGKGHSAIKDIITLLEIKDNNIDTAIREYQAERKALRKLCTEAKSKKEILSLISDILK